MFKPGDLVTYKSDSERYDPITKHGVICKVVKIVNDFEILVELHQLQYAVMASNFELVKDIIPKRGLAYQIHLQDTILLTEEKEKPCISTKAGV